jgi:hypothetical protein
VIAGPKWAGLRQLLNGWDGWQGRWPHPSRPAPTLSSLCARHSALIAAFNACDQDSGPDNPEWDGL